MVLKIQTMAMNTNIITLHTKGRGLYEISDQLNQFLANNDVDAGLAHVFCQHTSASLIVTENADSTVLHDLETLISRLAPDADPEYQHNYEGDDDMAAHVRSVLTTSDLTIPVINGCLALGTWQGVFLWEHRYQPHSRSIVLSIID